MILPRYFLREALKLSAAIVAGLFVIYLTTRFASYLGEAAEGKVAPQHISRIVLLKMLVSMKDLLPMSLFLGVYGAAVRIQLNSEWTAMRAAGLTHQQLLRPTLTMTLAAAIIVGLITLVVGPRAELTLQELREQTENEATIAGVKAGRFRAFSGGSQVFYAESLSPDEHYLEQTFVRSERRSRDDVMRAQRAHIETDPTSRDRFAIFENGTSWAGRPGALDFVVTDFERYALRIENREPTQFGAHIGFLFTSELLRHDDPAYAIELQWRLALPLCTLLGPPLALLIAVGTTSSRRGNWYLGLIIAVSAYFAYTNLLGVGRALMRKDVLPAALGLWPVHLVFVTVLALLLLWQRGRVRLRRHVQHGA
ncbi:MAG: LPS export ABC transporter permease LptF [Gammaproteobacteria bacterium]|nr:LPS export ABC transporter permease LptF [Gammaproteobacteria bacterium]